MRASELLAHAQAIYDDPLLPFANTAAKQGWRTGFASGAEWMRSVMEHKRPSSISYTPASYNRWGFFKYGMAGVCALAYLIFVYLTRTWLLLPGFVLVFYAVEAQMVFLFPLLIDGCKNPLVESRRWTQRAGGTLPVMITVMQLAVVMLFGGFVGKGFIRSWALGCIAVVVWYEDVRCVETRFA